MIAVVLIAEDHGWRATVRAMVNGSKIKVSQWFSTRPAAIEGQAMMLAQLGVVS